MRRSCVLSTALSACVLAACFEVPVLPARDAAGRDTPRRVEPVALTVVRVEATDVGGRAWPLDALPRSFVLHLESSAPLAANDEDVILVRGRADDALREDAARRPLNESTRARRIAAEVTVVGTHTELRPRAALAPGELVTLVIAAFATSIDGESLGETAVVEGEISASSQAGARVIATFPADGSADVPPNAEPFVFALDGEVALGGGAVILRAADLAIEHALGLAPCGPFGFEQHTCMLVAPASPLPSGTAITLETTSSLRDATGASVPTSAIHLTTALEADVDAPVLSSPSSCPIDASPDVSEGCVVATDRTWSITLEASEPVRIELALESGVVRALAPRGRATLSIAGLPPSHREEARLAMVDLAGLRTERPLTIATTAPLRELTITEVCADPIGPEPTQEWVEIANVGYVAVSLEGLTISDRDDLPGTPLGSSRVLVPGARVLVVGDGFDPDLAGAPPGAPLVTVGRTIVPSGLANGGEPLYLRDSDGHRLAHVPALGGEAGRCVVRREGGDPRADAITEFHYDACTPGR
jgi:hypothetical protein